MSLPSSPPSKTIWTVRKGDDGWPVFATQKLLNSVRFAEDTGWVRCTVDGIFGPQTDEAVRAFQDSRNLVVDGIFGPASSRAASTFVSDRAHDLLPTVPKGLMKGFAEGEAGNALAAVNWSVPGGVDCGLMQYRVYEPYDLTALQDAFDPMQATLKAANEFLGRAQSFYDARGVRNRSDRAEFAKRLAILAHNWPAGAWDIAYDGKLTNPDGEASWVARGTKFPDGTTVNTRLEWCQFYALGSSHGRAFIPKYVRDWGKVNGGI